MQGLRPRLWGVSKRIVAAKNWRAAYLGIRTKVQELKKTHISFDDVIPKPRVCASGARDIASTAMDPREIPRSA